MLVFGEWQPWGPHVVRWQLLEVCLWLCSGACYGSSAAVASGGASCTPRGWQVIVCLRRDHLRNDWVILFVLHDPGDLLRKAWGASTNALASGSGRSSTMAMSISPPSFLMRAGFPVCICSNIATALFSHRFRSHSSIALWASDPVWGGTVRTAGVPSAARKGLSGSVAAGTVVRAMTRSGLELAPDWTQAGRGGRR